MVKHWEYGVVYSRRAFSLVEVMISLVLSAVVAGSFVYWYFMGNQERYFARTVNRIQSAQEDLFSEIAVVANDAVRVNGFSQSAYSGVQDSASPQTNRENLRILRVRFSDVTAGIENVTIEGDPRQLRFQLTHVTGSSETEVRSRAAEEILSAYLVAAVENPRYLIFFKGDMVNILPVRFDQQTPTVVEDNVTLGWFIADLSAISPTVDSTTIAREIDRSAVVSMVEEVRLEFDGPGELTLVENFPDVSFMKRTTLQTGVERLIYNFKFSDHQRKESAEDLGLVLPDRFLQNWNAVDYQQSGCEPSGSMGPCCDPMSAEHLCVEAADMANMTVAIQMAANYTGRLPRVAVSDRMRLQGGRLERDAVFDLFPAGFGLRLASQGSNVEDTSCLNPQMRCTPGCASFYTDPNPRSPRWEGYARYVGNPDGEPSSYCQCGTGDNNDGDQDFAEHFIPPETPAGKAAVPAYRPPYDGDHNRQINACIQHFGDTYEWAWKHPVMWFWWNGIHASHKGNYRSGSFPNYTWNYQAYEDLRQNFLSYPDRDDPSSTWDDQISCRLNWDSISSNFRSIFWQRTSGGTEYGNLAAVTQPEEGAFSNFQSDHATHPTSGVKLIMMIEQKCACEPSGNIQAKYVCNHNASRTSPYCASTWVMEDNPSDPGNLWGKMVTGTESLQPGLQRKVYRVQSPTNEVGAFTTGLESVVQAGLCQCLNETYNTPHRDSVTTIPVYEGWAVSNIWDWRVDPADGNYLASIGTIDSVPMTTISGTAPILAVPGYPIREASFANHRMRAQNSPHVRTVRVHYQTADGQTPVLSDPIRCDSAWRGYLGRCTRPMDAGAEKTTITTNLAAANASLTAEQIEAYAGFCSKACYDEQLYAPTANGWYAQTGIRALRQALTQAPSLDEIPTWCGGRVIGGVSGF